MPTAAEQVPNGFSWIRRTLEKHTRELREMRARMASLTGVGSSLADKLSLSGGTLTGPLTVGDATISTDGVVTAMGLVLPPEVTTFSIGSTFPSPTTTTQVTWRAPKPCIVTNVLGYRIGGSGATINALNETNDLLATDLSLVTADSWLAAPAIQYATLETGATLSLSIRSVGGSPTSVVIQVELQEV